MDLGLKDRHVLVTGASQGIGRCLANAFADEGARVSVVARRTDVLAETLEEMGGEAVGHAAFTSDLTEIGAPEQVIPEIVAKQGAIQTVIHNLGGTLGVRDPLSSSVDWQRVWRLNVGVAIDINNLVVPTMQENGGGRLVHIVSTAADDYNASGPYAASKSYLQAYVNSLGRAMAPQNVIASGVSPGAFATYDNVWIKKQQDQPAMVQDFLSKHQAIGRLGECQELAPFVLLLGSDLASFASGCVLPVHGGCM